MKLIDAIDRQVVYLSRLAERRTSATKAGMHDAASRTEEKIEAAREELGRLQELGNEKGVNIYTHDISTW